MKAETTVALVSQTLRAGDKDYNLSRIEQTVTNQQNTCVDLFVFPENNIIGGLWKDGDADYKNLAESVPKGPSCQRVIQLAKTSSTTICAGIVEKKDGQHFFTHFLCDQSGFLGRQRKIFHRRPRNHDFSTGGDKLHIFNLFGYKCAILACADFMFPETTILAGFANVSLIICPTDCFRINEKDTMIKLLCAQSMHTGGKAVAAFGHSTSASVSTVLAGIAVDENGKIHACETRSINEDKVAVVSLVLAKSREQWWSFPERYNRLLGHLGNDSS